MLDKSYCKTRLHVLLVFTFMNIYYFAFPYFTAFAKASSYIGVRYRFLAAFFPGFKSTF
jgi:hypothetical protein